MDITEHPAGALVIVTLGGRVDGVSAPELEQRLKEIVARGNARILLDCGRMTYIGSAGLRTVLVGAKMCQQGGGQLALCALSAACKAVMDLSGVLTLVGSYETRAAALAAEA